MSAVLIQPVIMSGGAGTRLWPMSRRARPKQFLPLTGERSLFQETALRLSGPGFLPPLIIAGAAHAGLVAEQLAAAGVAGSATVIEPFARNTAAVAAIAAAWTTEAHKDALVLLAPADHHVPDAAAFREAILRGASAAAKGAIVTLGIKPTTPHIGFVTEENYRIFFEQSLENLIAFRSGRSIRRITAAEPFLSDSQVAREGRHHKLSAL